MVKIEKQNILVLSLMILIGGAIYLNSLSNGFHYDDGHHITGNPHIRSILNIPDFFLDPSLLSGFKSSGGGLYRPLLMVSYVFNYSLGGLNPIGYHLVNLVFHIGSAFMIYLIVRKLMLPSLSGFFPALASGFIFLVHPFNSEVVNYITARSSVMCAFFFLLSFWFWIRFRERNNGLNRWQYTGSLLFFILAMLTKEVAITLPAIFLLYDILSGSVRRSKSTGTFILHYLPFIAGVVLPYMIVRGALVGGTGISSPPAGYLEHLLTQPTVLLYYMKLLIFPANLSISHVIPTASGLDGLTILFILILVFTIGLAIWSAMKKGKMGIILSFSIFWFFITILPTTALPLTEMVQENRGYLPGVSFAVIAGVVFSRIGGSRTLFRDNKAAIPYLYGLLVLTLIIYSVSTVIRNHVWKNDITLWSDAAIKAPSSFRARYNLADSYSKSGDFGLSAREYTAALKLSPDSVPANHNLGVMFLRLNEPDLALKQFMKTTALSPEHSPSYVSIGNILASRKEWVKAEESYQKALRIDKDNSDALSSFGLTLMHQGKFSSAIPYLTRALQAKPGWSEVEVMLAYALDSTGRSSEAEVLYRKNAGDRDYTGIANEVRRYFSGIIPPP